MQCPVQSSCLIKVSGNRLLSSIFVVQKLDFRKGNLRHCWWDYKMMQPLWKTVIPQKFKIELPYDPAVTPWAFI